MMKTGRVTWPDGILIEVWKWLRYTYLLNKLINKIIGNGEMQDKWRISNLVHIYKNIGDIQRSLNHHAIKLVCHKMKLQERIIE